MNSSTKIPNQTITRIGKALLFIEENLQQKLSLELIAEKAHFSPYHFHRLFKIVAKETVNDFINRKRIEKAASYILHKKELTITEISEMVGFNSLSVFSRAFKIFYGKSPLDFRKEPSNKFSEICKTKSKKGQIETRFEQYIYNINKNLNWMKKRAKTQVVITEKLHLAYVNHQGRMDAIGNSYNRLMQWAAPKGLMSQEDLRMITIYHDSPKITDPNKIRMNACMTIPEDYIKDDYVNYRTIEPTKCMVAKLEVGFHEFQQAWESCFVWISENGYSKADIAPFEIYYNNPNEHPEGLSIVDLCIPVE